MKVYKLKWYEKALEKLAIAAFLLVVSSAWFGIFWITGIIPDEHHTGFVRNYLEVLPLLLLGGLIGLMWPWDD